MSPSVMVILTLVLLVPLWFQLRRDYVSGLSYGIVLLIASTHLLRIPTPGILPELSIHRLVILSFLLFWAANRNPDLKLSQVPLARHIRFWALVAFISLLGSIDLVTSVKRYLDYVLEFFLLYFILATTLRTRTDSLRILRAACFGLTIVAILAFVEKYSGFNPVEEFIPGVEAETGRLADVTGTYRHRILLGAGMAMAWPLLFWFSQAGSSRFRRQVAWAALVLVLAACYFARSRGPWLAAALAGGFMFWFGSPSIRKRLASIGVLTLILLLARPGVLGTISGLAEATVQVDSFKGGTFQYRLELWRVAFTEISKSPWRLLFGYGPGSGATTSLEWTLSYRDRDYEVTSWDNDFAYALYQYGFVGLIATFSLYAAICWRLFTHAKRLSGSEHDLFICLSASGLVLFFMMSNVMIFARQLYYLLWAVTAIGFVLKARTSLASESVDFAEATTLENAVPSRA